MVGHADLAGLGNVPAADHPGVANCVVGAAERAGAEQSLAGRELADGRVDAGGLEALGGGQGREDGRQPAAEHRLAGARGADHEQVVAAGRGDHHRPLGELLAADVGEVHVVPVEVGVGLFGPVGDRVELDAARDQPDGVGQGVDGEHLDLLNDRRLAGVLAGDEEPLEAPPAGPDGHRQDAPDRPDGPVQGQLADGGAIREVVRLDLPGGDEQAEGDRQVEGPGVLAEVGRGQVDDGPAGRAGVPEVGQGPLDPVDALPDGQLREPDQDGLGDRRGDRVDLDLDRDGVDPGQGEGVQLGQHRTPRAEDDRRTRRAGRLLLHLLRRGRVEDEPADDEPDGRDHHDQ